MVHILYSFYFIINEYVRGKQIGYIKIIFYFILHLKNLTRSLTKIVTLFLKEQSLFHRTHISYLYSRNCLF